MNYEWSLNIAISARRLFSDYLDDVSRTYPDADNVQDLRGDFATRFIDRSGELYAKDPDFFTRNSLEFPIGEEGRQREILATTTLMSISASASTIILGI
ncbi:MAG: hypothetical protein R2788_13800 [Saprospiraceae bacterium]